MINRAQRNVTTKLIGRLAATCLLVGIPIATSGPASAQTRLSADAALYPRVRQLANGEYLATVTAFGGGNHIDVYSGGTTADTFTRVGQITDPEFSSGLCCGSIFQLTQTIGTLPSGTLIWAGSVGQDAGANRRMKIKLYRSSDNGRSWVFLSAITSPNAGGLWEPELSIASDGALVMMYSDETAQGSWDQRLVKTRTYNGTTWVDTANMVASGVVADRPGMAVVSRLANGNRFMTFELCGPAACTTFSKTSTDGWNWGAATDVGVAIRLSDGRYLAHAPTNTVLPNGAIIVVGQMVMNANNTVAAANGTVLFKSASGSAAGPWTTIAAPVPVPGANNTPCPNYSSTLRSATNGTQVLELAGRSEASCTIYFRKGSIN